jgi:hypothetical protein
MQDEQSIMSWTSCFTLVDFITALFCRMDGRMRGVAKHAQALLYPSELVTIGSLYALKGYGERAFYR